MTKTTKETLKRFQNMTIQDLHNKYLFLDNNKFFEVYNDELYLHIISLAGVIEWTLSKEDLFDCLKYYASEIQRISGDNKDE